MIPLALAAGAVLASAETAQHFGPVASVVLVYVLGGGLMLLVVLAAALAAVHNRRRERVAEAAYDPGAPLEPGPMMLHGAVEYARDAEHAVRVEVDQLGVENESSGSWSTSWTEAERRMKVAPFYLRLASDRRIRVEPTADVYLVDAMDGAIRVDLTRRTRFAELTPGEQIFAYGRLERSLDPERVGGPYRGESVGLVLLPPRRGRMLLSSHPLGHKFAKRASVHRWSALLLLLVTVAFQLVWLPYHLRRWAGETVQAEITALRHYTTKDDEGDTHHHYQVKVRMPDGAPFADETRHAQFRRLRRGQRVWVRVAPGPRSWATLGLHATVGYAALGALLMMLFFTLIPYALVLRSLRSWYEGAEVSDSESGRLRESFQRRQQEAAAGDSLSENGS